MVQKGWVKRSLVAAVAAAMGVGSLSAEVVAEADEGAWRPLSTAVARVDNPLKGFLPFGLELDHENVSFPYTMEWFYLPLNAVVKGPNQYDWSLFEKNLSEISSRGNQAVLRFYVDYPGKESGLPSYILEDGSVVRHSYDFFDNNGKSVSPDYNNPKVQTLLKDFISEFGNRYDGDPRIGFITTGLIGFWGEQHTWPMNGYADPNVNPAGEQWMPEREVELGYYRAWDAAFDSTELLNRYPYGGLEGIDVGFHDDSFAVSTLPGVGWHFMDHMIANGETSRWQTNPIGGEVQPPIQKCVFTVAGCVDGVVAEDFAEATKQTHASWLMNHVAYSVGYEGKTLENALAAHAALGYDLVATQARIGDGADSTTVSVRIENRGVAPFYYDWPMEFGLLNSSGELVESVKIKGKLPTILPGQSVEITAVLPAGAGVIGLRVPNPMENGAALKFANLEQDAEFEGWLSLGKVVEGVSSPVPSPVASVSPSVSEVDVPAVKPAQVSSRPGLPSTGFDR